MTRPEASRRKYTEVSRLNSALDELPDSPLPGTEMFVRGARWKVQL